MIRDSSVSIATAYGLGGRGSIPGKGKRCSLLHSVQTGSVAHPASYTMGTVGSFPGVNRQGMKLTTHLHLVPR
jgi:hypothetical protein